MSDEVFFQTNYAWANNVGRVVGFDKQNLYVLDKDVATSEWQLNPIPAADVMRIKVSHHRSLYLLVFALLAAMVAAFVAWMGIAGEITGLGVFTVPPILAFFAYWATSGSKFLKLSFETIGKTLKYKSFPGSLNETRVATQKLIEWANNHRIAITADLKT